MILIFYTPPANSKPTHSNVEESLYTTANISAYLSFGD